MPFYRSARGMQTSALVRAESPQEEVRTMLVPVATQMFGPVSNWKRYVISAILGTDVPLWITIPADYKLERERVGLGELRLSWMGATA